MDRRDQKLLDKQLWGVSPSPPHSGLIIGFMTVFLIGIGIGDILSKAKKHDTPQANANYSAVSSFSSNEKE